MNRSSSTCECIKDEHFRKFHNSWKRSNMKFILVFFVLQVFLLKVCTAEDNRDIQGFRLSNLQNYGGSCSRVSSARALRIRVRAATMNTHRNFMRMSMLVGYTPARANPFARANRAPVNFYLRGDIEGRRMDMLPNNNWGKTKKTFYPLGASAYGQVFDFTFLYNIATSTYTYYDNKSNREMESYTPRLKNRGLPDYFLIDGAFQFHNWTITLEC